MGTDYSQLFEMGKRTLCFDSSKSSLLCRETESGKNLWIKKIDDITGIDNLIEDSTLYYVACERDDIHGYYLALEKSTGSTAWFIPGKAYFQVIFDSHLYLIFTDMEKDYYLIKVDRSNGKKVWHHRVNDDLCEYSFRSDRILLKYASGKTESIVPATGSVRRNN